MKARWGHSQVVVRGEIQALRLSPSTPPLRRRGGVWVLHVNHVAEFLLLTQTPPCLSAQPQPTLSAIMGINGEPWPGDSSWQSSPSPAPPAHAHLQPGKHAGPLVAKAVLLELRQLRLWALSVHLLLHLPVVLLFILPLVIAGSLRGGGSARFWNAEWVRDDWRPLGRSGGWLKRSVSQTDGHGGHGLLRSSPALMSSTRGLAEREPLGASRLVSIWRPSKCSPALSFGTLSVNSPSGIRK